MNIDYMYQQPRRFELSQYDTGYPLTVSIWNNGSPVAISGTVTLVGTKPSGESFEIACTYTGNVVTIPVTTEITDEYGEFPAELRIGEIGTQNCVIHVEISPAQMENQTVSGSVVEFEAPGVYPLPSVFVWIEAAQDLNGYDAPWPGGSKKNIFDDNGIGYWATATGNWQTTGGAANYRASKKLSATPGDSYTISVSPEITTRGRVYMCRWMGDTYIGSENTTASPAVFEVPSDCDTIAFDISFGTNANAQAAEGLIQLEKGDTATDFVPYENICPISGWDGVSITKTGKNLLPILGTSSTSSGVAFTANDDGSITASGTASGNAWYNMTILQRSFPIDVILSGCPVGSDGSNYRLQANVDGTNVYDTGEGVLIPAGSVINTPIIRIASGQVVSGLTFYPMIRPATLDDSYEKYASEVIPISWQTEAGTVYGGAIVVTTGLLRVTHKAFDLGAATWTAAGGGRYWRTAAPADSQTVHQLGRPAISSVYPNYMGAASQMPDIAFSLNNGSYSAANKYIIVRDSNYADAAAFKTAMAGQTMVYRLETPLEYRLAPTEVRTLTGTNVMWADTGNIEVEYINYS